MKLLADGAGHTFSVGTAPPRSLNRVAPLRCSPVLAARRRVTDGATPQAFDRDALCSSGVLMRRCIIEPGRQASLQPAVKL